MDIRPLLESALDAFALDAIVTPTDGPAVETRAFWLPPVTVDVPIGSDARRAENVRVLVISKADVPQIQRGALVEIAEYEGGEPALWSVDGMDGVQHDHHRVIVVPYGVGT